jgi:aryl-alcohol dehydrogenase-like predicted oxidoreductase
MAATGMTSRVYRTREPGAVDQAALPGGVNWFDTARGYGHGEPERALTASLRAVGVRLGEVLILTKWLPVGRRSAGIARTIGDRIGALQGYPVDPYQIHQPWGLSSVQCEMREMPQLLRAAKIWSIGVSDFSARQMSRAAAARRVELAADQGQINLLNRNVEGHGVLDTARKRGVTLMAYPPLQAGILTGRFRDDPVLRRAPLLRGSLFGRSYDLDRSRPLVRELGRIADAYGVSRAQVGRNWLINCYGAPVPRSRVSPQRTRLR